MKRFILFFAIQFSFFSSFSQANLVIEAPMNDNTGGINRGPNGTSLHAFLRGCYLVPQTELVNIPSGTNLTSFGFTMIVGGTGVPVSGNFTVYLQNTTDLAYQKGTVFNTAITSMTNCYASVMTVPVSAVTTSVIVTLTTPFNYTGGGLYVAYDWASTGPFNATAANYLGETIAFPLPSGGGANFFSSTSAPATMTLTNSRPAFLFGFANPNTNDIRVWGIEAPGKVAATLNTAHNIKAIIRNSGTATQNNYSVFLNVTGANVFSNMQVIPSLAPGASIPVTFSAFNPLILGLNTISVSVASDQNNFNNSLTYPQSVNCDTWAQNPPTGTYTNGAGFATGPGIIATGFFNPVASSIIGINLDLSSDPLNVGQQLYGLLMDASGNVIATTNTLTLTSGMLGTLQNFSFTPAVILTTNTQYNIGIAQLNPTPVAFRPFGYRSSYYTSSTLYTYTGITAGFLLPLVQNFGYFGIEAVLKVNNNLSIVSTPSAVCLGDCATLSAPLGLSNYTWSTGSIGPAITACPQPVNTYSIVGTNTLGCPALATISIPVNPLPNVSINSFTNAVCLGTAFTFTAQGANSYSLNNISTLPTITQNPLTNTNYTITGVDGNGCSNSTTIGVSVFSVNFTSSPNANICIGKSLTLTANPAAYNYNWTDGFSNFPFQTPNLTPTITTTYTVTGVDLNGCSLSNTVLVTVNPNPTITTSASKTVICKGESVTLTASGAATYTWNGSTNSAALTVSPPTNTTYVVVGATNAGCTRTLNVSQVVADCTGLDEMSRAAPLITIFPNPNNGSFVIRSDSFERGRCVYIYNTLGSLIRRIELNNNNMMIDLYDESNGIYFLQILENNKALHMSKIIKQ